MLPAFAPFDPTPTCKRARRTAVALSLLPVAGMYSVYFARGTPTPDRHGILARFIRLMKFMVERIHACFVVSTGQEA